MSIQLLIDMEVPEMEPEREGRLQETTVGVTELSKKPELYPMRNQFSSAFAFNSVAGVNAKVSLTPVLLQRRSRGSMNTLAAETDPADTCGSSRSCSVATADMKRMMRASIQNFLNQNVVSVTGAGDALSPISATNLF